MGAPRRAFGWADDMVVGGTPYDTLVSGAVPDPTQLWPVTSVTVEDGETQLTRADEVRGRRPNTAPEEFKEAPMVTVKGRLYPPIAKKLIQLMTGTTPSVTGAAPAATTRKWTPVAYGVSGLPAVHLGVLRDDLYQKGSGFQLARATFSFPIDGHATYEAVFAGLYMGPSTDATVAPNFAYLQPEWVYKLRDAEAKIDGSATAIDGLRMFEFTFDNQHEDPEHWPKRNRYFVAGTGGDRDRILWFPQQRILGASSLHSAKLGFYDVKTQEEQARHLVKARQVVFTIEGPTLATTPTAKQLLRYTGFKGVYTGGGPSDLQKDGRTTSDYDMGIFGDETTGQDVSLEMTDAT